MEAQNNNDKGKEQKICFFITPIGEDYDETRKNTDGLIELLKPIFLEYNYNIFAAHQMAITGNISDQIIQKIVNSDLVLANLTGLNSNVMYELGVRHATGKPTLTIAQNNTKLPFDVTQERTVFYYDTISHATIFVNNIREFLRNIDDSILSSNPVTRILEKSVIAVAEHEKDVNKIIYRELNDIKALLSGQRYQIGDFKADFRNLYIVLKGNYESSDLTKTTEILGQFFNVSSIIYSGDKGADQFKATVQSQLNHSDFLSYKTLINALLNTNNLPTIISMYH